METHYITKTFECGESMQEEIDDFLNGLTVEFGNDIDIVGYTGTMTGVCVTVEVQYQERESQ